MTINSTYFLKQGKSSSVIKVDSNNCVIVHSIEEKLYTKSDMIKYASWRYLDKKMHGNKEEVAFNKWIKENLKIS